MVLAGTAAVRAAAATELGVSNYVEVTQRDVDVFADVTGDHQWIHVDPELAKKGPFGGTIAHGFFTLSMAPRLQDQVVRFEGFEFGINYGLNKVRFPSPVPVGSKVRVRVQLETVEEVPGGLQLVLRDTFEVEGVDKPACVAKMVVRLFGDQTS